MEDLVDEGYVRNIGLCNFTSRKIDVILRNGRIPPAVCEVEMHPYCPQNRLLEFCKRSKVQVLAQAPLGTGFPPSPTLPTLLESKSILNVAKAKRRTPSQVALKWALQRGTAVVPKCQTLVSLNNCLNVYDFNLNDLQCHEISKLGRNSHRYVDGKLFVQKGQTVSDFWDGYPDGE